MSKVVWGRLVAVRNRKSDERRIFVLEACLFVETFFVQLCSRGNQHRTMPAFRNGLAAVILTADRCLIEEAKQELLQDDNTATKLLTEGFLRAQQQDGAKDVRPLHQCQGWPGAFIVPLYVELVVIYVVIPRPGLVVDSSDHACDKGSELALNSFNLISPPLLHTKTLILYQLLSWHCKYIRSVASVELADGGICPSRIRSPKLADKGGWKGEMPAWNADKSSLKR